jgi:glutamyl-Q tRNA(Asp) synthetase
MSVPDIVVPPSPSSVVTRFAPSPTGALHLGHAFAALFAADRAAEAGGRFLLRFEDIDRERCRPEFEQGIVEDLRWLGLSWPEPVRRQSEHFEDYRVALARLAADGLLYPCFCTRRDIQDEIARAGAAPHGPDGPLYPGICRTLSRAESLARQEDGVPHALRLDGRAAMARAGALSFHDRGQGWVEAQPALFGDVVLARKDVPASYHLAVTLDDHAQGVTLVTRGDDLFAATHLHRLLQALLGLNVPDYHHHRLVTDPSGRKFSKRDRDVTLKSLRGQGTSPQALRGALGL